MYKEDIIFDAIADKTKVLDFEGGGLRKLASQESHIPEKLASAIRDIEASPDPNMAYMYDRALGCGEVYGPNNNGDWFGRGELKNRHSTFEKHASLYRHHKKGKGNEVGDVMASAYNEPLDTVDLIIRAPLDKVASDIEKLDDGHTLATSMGAKVKHDECSICGNKASNRLSYCGHLRNHMLKIYPDGRQVYAKNPNPKFVDISMVVIPADPASAVLRKIANLGGGPKINRDPDPMFEKFGEEGRDTIRPELIEATNHLDRDEALQTLHAAKGVLRPDEFQAVMRKDASLINPDVIPYVSVEPTQEKFITGRPLIKLAYAMADIDGVPLEKKAQLKNASFLDRDEKMLYLQYRRLFDSRAFLR